MSNDSERPGFLDRSLARVWRSAQQQQEKELKNKLYLTLHSNQYNAKITETLEDVYLWVDDSSIPIEWRVEELVNLVGRLSTLAEAKQDEISLRMRSNYHKLVHRFWYGRALLYLHNRRKYGRSADPLHLPLGRVVDMVTRFGERWIIPIGKDVVDCTFGRDFHSPEFVLGMQSPPQMFPFMDQRFGGEGGEVFAEDLNKGG